MNKRIRELEKQSGLEIYGLGKDRAKWQAAVEKFAELIVRECISKLDGIGVIDRDSRTIAMKVISEHFGVEE